MPVRGGGFMQGYNAQNVASADGLSARGGDRHAPTEVTEVSAIRQTLAAPENPA